MMKQLSLGELLRYALSGAVFVGAYAIARHGASGPSQLLGSADRRIIVAVVAILAGVLTYALHRALYRIIIRIVLAYLRVRGLVCSSFAFCCGFHASEFKRDYTRWVRHHNYPLFHERLQLWASHVHFLYCSAWAAGGGAIVGHLLPWAAAQPRLAAFAALITPLSYRPGGCCGFVLCFAAGSLVAALVQDCSLTYTDCRLCEDSRLDGGIPNLPEHLKPPIQAEKGSDEKPGKA